jgi:tRNA-dihydrouridine synthase
MRKIAIWYLKKMPRATVLRGKITSAKSYEELLKVIHDVGHP